MVGVGSGGAEDGQRRTLGGREKGEEGVAHNPSIFEWDGHFSSILLMVVMATCLESTQPFLKLSWDGHVSSIFLMVVMATCLESTQPFFKLSSVLLK